MPVLYHAVGPGEQIYIVIGVGTHGGKDRPADLAIGQLQGDYGADSPARNSMNEKMRARRPHHKLAKRCLISSCNFLL